MPEYEAGLRDLFLAFVDSSLTSERPVYVTSGINPALLEGYRRAPSGLAYRLYRMEDTTSPRPRVFSFRPFPLPRANALAPRIRQEYAEGYAYQGAYRLTVGDTIGGAALLRRAVATQPGYQDAENLLRYVESVQGRTH